MMRTTVDLPADLHRAASSLARDNGRTLSQTVSDLLRRALHGTTGDQHVSIDEETGLLLVNLGHPLTTDMVRAAADEQ